MGTHRELKRLLLQGITQFFSRFWSEHDGLSRAFGATVATRRDLIFKKNGMSKDLGAPEAT